jgi:hypothetical protein
MQYLNVCNLDKYQSGYRDRNIIWIKVYMIMIHGSYHFEMMHEIDKWRFVTLCMLQSQTKKPVPNDKEYLCHKGMNFKHRPLGLTVNSLIKAQLIDIVNVTQHETNDNLNVESCNVTEDQHSKVRPLEKSRVDKNRVYTLVGESDFEVIWQQYPKKIGRKDALRHFNASVKTAEGLIKIGAALENYLYYSRDKEERYIKNGDSWFNNWEDWIKDPTDTRSDAFKKAERTYHESKRNTNKNQTGAVREGQVPGHPQQTWRDSPDGSPDGYLRSTGDGGGLSPQDFLGEDAGDVGGLQPPKSEGEVRV